MAIRHTVIRRTVTATVHIIIRTMGGTIPGLGTATVGMDIRTIGNQNIETRPSTDGARLLFSLIKLQALKTQAVNSRAVEESRVSHQNVTGQTD